MTLPDPHHRAPVRSAAAAGPALWPALVGRVFTNQMWVELYGLPGYGKTLDGKTAGFGAAPRDFRPHDEGLGRSVLAGRFLLAGAGMDAPPPSDPWNRPSPNRAFAVELHAFAWLPSLMRCG